MTSRTHRLGADDGLTLVELIVSTVITALIAVLTTTLVIGVQQTNQQNVARQDQIDGARTAIAAMAKTLRAAVTPSQLSSACDDSCADIEAFEFGGTYKVQFHSNIDNPRNSVGPSRVTYEVITSGAQAGTLIETVQIPSSPKPSRSGYQYCQPGTTGCDKSIVRRTLAKGVVSSGDPVIRYFDRAGNELIPGPATSLSSAQLASVLSVELKVTVETLTGERPKPTTYVQRILMPNRQEIVKSGDS